MDPENFGNYRPISNLSFLSKITEKVVLAQLLKHLQTNKLLYHLQSAYRSDHSTETALLKICNNILSALDNKNVALLSLLDISAAFDTVDHSILLSRRQTCFGISGLCSHGLSRVLPFWPLPKCFSSRNPVHSFPSLVQCSPGLCLRSHPLRSLHISTFHHCEYPFAVPP